MAELAFKISPSNIIADFGYFESWSQGTSVAPDGWVMIGTAGAVAQESTTKKFGNYALKITSGASATYAAEYTVPTPTAYAGRTMTFGVWVKCSSASKARVYVDDGVSARANSSYHTGGGDWEFLEVEAQIDASNTELVLGVEVASSAVVAYFDGAVLVQGETIFTDFRGTNIYVRSESWESKVSFEVSRYTVVRKRGIEIDAVEYRERAISLNVQIHEDTFTAARTIFDALMKAIGTGTLDLYFEDDRYSEVRLINLPDLNQLVDGKAFTFRLSFSAPEPFKKYIGKIRSHQDVTASPHTFNVAVLGSAPTRPRFTFLPVAVTLSSLTMENLTTGKRFSYTQDVAVGSTLVIDCETLEILINGVESASEFIGDLPEFELDPATNYFKFTGTTGMTIWMDRLDKWI